MSKQAINIIFDGPPDHMSPRFVEVETDDGKSIIIGEWLERRDGYWALRISDLPDTPTGVQYPDVSTNQKIQGFRRCTMQN